MPGITIGNTEQPDIFFKIGSEVKMLKRSDLFPNGCEIYSSKSCKSQNGESRLMNGSGAAVADTMDKNLYPRGYVDCHVLLKNVFS